VRVSRSILDFRFSIFDFPIFRFFRAGESIFYFLFFDFSVRWGCNSRNRVSQPKYIISTMSLEAEIRFLEFLCIADVEGRRKKEDPSCYRPQ
jgi:hypothetical protein